MILPQLRCALVTGGAKRIGKAIVEDLAAHGFAVAIHARGSTGEAEALAKDIVAGGGKAVAISADLRSIADTQSLIGRCVDRLGPLDLLINNASIFRKDLADTFDADVWQDHFDVHVRAPSILSAEFAAQLPREAKGMIVNIIDQRVWKLNPAFYSYTLSKAALWTATKTMAQSFAPRVRVNAIGPGPTMRSERQSEEDFQAQVEALIMKIGPRIDEFGRTVRYLYETPSITGQMIALDGGQHLGWQTPDVAGIME